MFLAFLDIYRYINNKHTVMDKNELFEQIQALVESFETNHNKTTKVSDTRARKDSRDIVKLLKEYNRVSLAESKQ